jgi:hypothetical protein
MKTGKVLFTLFVFSKLSFGQCQEYDLQPPHLSDVAVRSSVTQDPASKIFTFKYSITNGVLSTGCINRFEMDIIAPVGGIELSNVGLVNYPRYVDRGALQFNPSLRIIPVGIPKLPRYKGFSSAWWAGFSVDGRLGWMGADRILYLEPGATIDSIVMTSHGIPALRSFVISPSYNPKLPYEITLANEDSIRRFIPEPTEEEEAAFQRLLDSIKVRGVTIGPTAPPANFIPLFFLDTLISYKHQAFSLGWIKNQGIVQSLDAKLDNAKRQLQRNNTTAARNTLQAFVNEVEALWKGEEHPYGGKQITSEAYALLKFNAEYLVSKL